MRYAAPLCAVDQVEAAQRDGALAISARKRVVETDPYLSGHFPGRLIFPGVFILETVRQAVISAMGERDGEICDLTGVRSVRFVGALRAGDVLRVAATATRHDHGGVAVDARCWRESGGQVARLLLDFGYRRGAGDA